MSEKLYRRRISYLHASAITRMYFTNDRPFSKSINLLLNRVIVSLRYAVTYREKIRNCILFNLIEFRNICAVNIVNYNK